MDRRQAVHHNKRKTHCPRGHEYSGDNIKPVKGKWRACRECVALRRHTPEAIATKKEYDRLRYVSNRTKIRKRIKMYYRNNREKCLAYRKRHRMLDPRKTSAMDRRGHLKRSYGLSMDRYNELVSRQRGLCLICQRKPKKLVVDHCHKSKAIRGLLCNPCNVGIGFLRDSADNLLRATAYLKGRQLGS